MKRIKLRGKPHEIEELVWQNRTNPSQEDINNDLEIMVEKLLKLYDIIGENGGEGLIYQYALGDAINLIKSTEFIGE